jgi:hypothetical protein
MPSNATEQPSNTPTRDTSPSRTDSPSIPCAIGPPKRPSAVVAESVCTGLVSQLHPANVTRSDSVMVRPGFGRPAPRRSPRSTSPSASWVSSSFARPTPIAERPLMSRANASSS